MPTPLKQLQLQSDIDKPFYAKGIDDPNLPSNTVELYDNMRKSVEAMSDYHANEQINTTQLPENKFLELHSSGVTIYGQMLADSIKADMSSDANYNAKSVASIVDDMEKMNKDTQYIFDSAMNNKPEIRASTHVGAISSTFSDLKNSLDTLSRENKVVLEEQLEKENPNKYYNYIASDPSQSPALGDEAIGYIHNMKVLSEHIDNTVKNPQDYANAETEFTEGLTKFNNTVDRFARVADESLMRVGSEVNPDVLNAGFNVAENSSLKVSNATSTMLKNSDEPTIARLNLSELNETAQFSQYKVFETVEASASLQLDQSIRNTVQQHKENGALLKPNVNENITEYAKAVDDVHTKLKDTLNPFIPNTNMPNSDVANRIYDDYLHNIQNLSNEIADNKYSKDDLTTVTDTLNVVKDYHKEFELGFEDPTSRQRLALSEFEVNSLRDAMKDYGNDLTRTGIVLEQQAQAHNLKAVQVDPFKSASIPESASQYLSQMDKAATNFSGLEQLAKLEDKMGAVQAPIYEEITGSPRPDTGGMMASEARLHLGNQYTEAGSMAVDKLSENSIKIPSEDLSAVLSKMDNLNTSMSDQIAKDPDPDLKSISEPIAALSTDISQLSDKVSNVTLDNNNSDPSLN